MALGTRDQLIRAGIALVVVVIAVVAAVLVGTSRNRSDEPAASIDTGGDPADQADGGSGRDATPAPDVDPTVTPGPEPTLTPVAGPTPEPTVVGEPTTTPPPRATPTETPTAGPTAGRFAIAALDITISHPDADTVRYLVSCDGAEPADVCAAVSDRSVRARLIDGPQHTVCTEIYGGPDVARIVGSIDGLAVDTVVDRANGCGIDDWDNLLAGILRPATGIVEPTATPTVEPSPTPTATVDPTATPEPSPTAAETGRISGSVLAGPTCPVQREDEECPPQPVEGAVRLIADGQTVATTPIDADGNYAADVPPGAYTVAVDVATTPFPLCGTAQATVTAGATVVANIDCDTGIR